VPVTDNSMNERTQTAFCLGPVDCSRTGAYKMFNPLTGQVVERSQFTQVPLSNYHIQLLQRCADPTNNELVFRRGSLHSAILADEVDFIRHEAPIPLEPVPQLTGVLPPINFDEIYPDADVIPTENPIHNHAPTIIRAEDAPMTLPLGGATIDYRVDITHDDEHTIGGVHTEDNLDDQGFIVSDAYDFNQAVTTIDATLPAPVTAPIVVPSDASPLRVSARSNKNVNRYLSDEYYTSKDSEYHSKAKSGVFRVTQSPKQAIASRGAVAMRALIGEIMQLDDKDTFDPVHSRDMTKEEFARLLLSFTFLEDKYDATSGNYVKTKARTVGGGNRQDRDLVGDIYSPTASTSALFIGAGLAAMEGRTVCTLDIPTAYPNAKQEKDAAPVHVILKEFEAAILTLLHPERNLEAYIRGDRSMICQVKTALYGLIESARLWYNDISSTLLGMGFIRNDFEQAVFNKTTKGVQTSIYLYVDDMMISSTDKTEIKAIHRDLESKYGVMALHEGMIHSFLGMSFNFETTGKCKISMEQFINELLHKSVDLHKYGSAETPAGDQLFNVRDDIDVLPGHKQELIHGLVASLLYLAKRTRPDLLTAVGFLTRRVKKYNADDEKKLVRLLKYLNHTKDLPYVLSFQDPLVVVSSADASYATTHDFRSVSGGTVSLGGAVVHAESKTQKIVTKSSHEAEIVCTSDYGGRPLWTRNFLAAQGYSVSATPVIIEQDNMGAMATLTSSKPPSDKSRHINIRYFWLGDRIKAKEVLLQYIPTSEMLADILTKPLQGQRFKTLRDRLLGISSGTLQPSCLLIY